MAVPKQRTSKARKNQRRSHDKLAAPPMSKCSECGAPRLPHRVCPSCGFYKDRTVIEIAED